MKYLMYLRKYLLYCTLFVPLFYVPLTTRPAHFPKTMIFQILVDLILLITFICLFKAEKKITPPKVVGYWKNYLDVAVVVFIGILVVTSWTGINAGLSFWGNDARANGALTWVHFGIWYFCLKKIWKEKDWKMGWIISLGVAAAVTLSAIFQNSLPKYWGLEGDRLQGFIGNADFLALYLVPAFSMFILLALAEWKEKGLFSWKTIAYGVGAIVVGGVLVLTQSRGSIIGLGLGVIAALTAACFVLPTKKSKMIAGGSLIGVVATGLFLVSIARLPWVQLHIPLINRFFDVSAFAQGTGQTRLWAWEIAWQGFKERPLIGGGLGSYEAVFSKYYNPYFLRFAFTETVWDKPHNWFLEIANSSGILGLISYVDIFVIAIGYSLKSGVYGLDGDKKKQINHFSFRVVSIIVMGTLVAYGVQQVFLFESTNSLLLFFFLLASISIAFDKASVEDAAPSLVAWPLWVQKILAAVGCVVVFVVLYKGSFLPLKASYYLQQARQAIDPNVWADKSKVALKVPVAFRGEVGVFLAERFIQLDKSGVPVAQIAEKEAVEVAEFLNEQGKLYPLTIAYPVWAGQMYSTLGLALNSSSYLDKAEVELVRARNLSPQKQDVLFLLSRLYLLKKDFKQAIEIQKAAVAADPSIGISHWFLALTYQAAGNEKEALAEISQARTLGLSLTNDQKMYVIDLYTVAKDYATAANLYKEFIAAEPDNPNWYVRLAALYALAGDKKSALEYAERAVMIEPQLRAQADIFIKENNLK